MADEKNPQLPIGPLIDLRSHTRDGIDYAIFNTKPGTPRPKGLPIMKFCSSANVFSHKFARATKSNEFCEVWQTEVAPILNVPVAEACHASSSSSKAKQSRKGQHQVWKRIPIPKELQRLKHYPVQKQSRVVNDSNYGDTNLEQNLHLFHKMFKMGNSTVKLEEVECPWTNGDNSKHCVPDESLTTSGRICINYIPKKLYVSPEKESTSSIVQYLLTTAVSLSFVVQRRCTYGFCELPDSAKCFWCIFSWIWHLFTLNRFYQLLVATCC
ncbi:hypothetical protein EMCRGX_G033419 [Ephydatia muelleri]